jgi:hypothetical protein
LAGQTELLAPGVGERGEWRGVAVDLEVEGFSVAAGEAQEQGLGRGAAR